ncbi:MAG: ATP-binding protein [Odoribacter sp.]
MKDLASHIMDIVENSIRAKARKVEIDVCENYKEDSFVIEIRDNGGGMNAETLKQVGDPFYTSRTVRKVGLGIPLLIQNAEQTGGKVTIHSIQGEGTSLCARFTHSHLDRPPFGDVAIPLGLLAVAHPAIRFIYTHTTPEGRYLFDTENVYQLLNGVPLDHPDVLSAMQEMIRENLKNIHSEQYINGIRKEYLNTKYLNINL